MGSSKVFLWERLSNSNLTGDSSREAFLESVLEVSLIFTSVICVLSERWVLRRKTDEHD